MSGTNPALAKAVRMLRRERETHRFSLVEITGTVTGPPVYITRSETVLGSAPDADVRLSSPRAGLRHALLRVRGRDCQMIDNGSGDGVILNEVKVHAAVLRDGDVIQLAGQAFVFHEG